MYTECSHTHTDTLTHRYHRWLGHAVMVMVTAHSLGFWGIWLVQGKLVEEAFDQGRVFNK